MLAEIYSQALASNGYRVIRQFDIGPRELVDPALERGLVELVPEYGGSALTFLGATAADASDPVAVHRTLARAFETRGITTLAAAPAEDQNGFAVTSQNASKYDLVRLSDLAPIAGDLTLGGPPECPQRPLCAGGLASTYGLRFERFQPLDASGPVTTDALKAGSVDVCSTGVHPDSRLPFSAEESLSHFPRSLDRPSVASPTGASPASASPV